MWTYVWIFIGVFLFYKLIKYGSFINIEYPIENFSIGRGGNLGLFNGFIKLEDIGGTRLVVVYHTNGTQLGSISTDNKKLYKYVSSSKDKKRNIVGYADIASGKVSLNTEAFKKLKSKDATPKKKAQRGVKSTDAEKYKTNIPSYIHEIYAEFPIKGISFCDIKDSDVGVFAGYAVAETDNKYDKYAVSVYRKDGKRFGYTPREMLDLHRYIIHEGGQVNIHGEINKSDEGYFYGKVFIEYDPNLIN